MKLKELVGIRKVLDALMKEKVSPKLAYKFMKLSKKIEAEECFFDEKIREIIDEYGVKDEHGNPVLESGGVKIQGDKAAVCHEKVSELENIEIEKIEITFTVDELDELRLSMEDMLALSVFIDGE